MSIFYNLLKNTKNFLFHDYVFLTVVLAFLVLITTLIVLTIKYKKEKRKNKIVLNSVSVEDNSIAVPKSIEYLSCVEEGYSVYQGYVDINFLKEMISELKDKCLEYEDEKFIDEFETYLLNFVSRQPTALERTTLSNYVSKTIKKIAKYS